jgi:hypothetical protein
VIQIDPDLYPPLEPDGSIYGLTGQGALVPKTADGFHLERSEAEKVAQHFHEDNPQLDTYVAQVTRWWPRARGHQLPAQRLKPHTHRPRAARRANPADLRGRAMRPRTSRLHMPELRQAERPFPARWKRAGAPGLALPVLAA